MNDREIEEYLDTHGMLVKKNVGTSMMPLIRQGRDLMVIRKVSTPPKRKDAVLYKRGDKYVLHRIVGIKKDGYVLCGDHHWQKEYPVTDDKIIGILKSVIRDGKEIKSTSLRYKIYTFLWCDLFPIRAAILKIKYKLHILKRKIKK